MPTLIESALLSLAGLSVGDALGELFYSLPLQALETRSLPPGPWRWTDDTHMALSVVEILHIYGCINQDALARAFAERFMQEPWRGYAGGAQALLTQIYRGEDWRKVSPRLFSGGSYGNGAAMRAAPIGGFFAGDPARAAAEARLSAVITHAHPEGQAGAMAVAAAAAIAARAPLSSGKALIQEVLNFVPDGATRNRIEQSLAIPVEHFTEAVQLLGTGRQVSAQDTVPFCLWSAAQYLDNFEQALWCTLRGLGDRDTTCAIVGGIVALSARSIPVAWRARREKLPEGFSHSELR